MNHTAVKELSGGLHHEEDDCHHDNTTLVVGDGHGNDSITENDCGVKTEEALEVCGSGGYGGGEGIGVW